jgi:N-methylhydantoinase B/oxoprolinase/acetone carboxylase alpha subunit
VFVAASRTPIERRGDLDAQVGANRIGVARLALLADEPFEEVLDHGERRMRRALERVPPGDWSASDVLDSAGPRPAQQSASTIAVTMRFAGGEVVVDLTESDAQRAGNVNAPLAVTTSAVMFALVSVLDPTLPVNGGTFRPVRIESTAGSVVDATEPVAVGAGNVEVSQRVADVCLRAIAGALPGSVPAASQGTMNNVLIGGDSWVYYETLAGGQGGRPPRDGAGPVAGMNGVHTNMTNTANTPIESLERHYEIRVRSTSLRRGSGGDGAAPGGEGVVRELEVLEPVTVSLIAERHRSRPWGLDGGGDGASGEHWLLPEGDESRARRLPDKCTLSLDAGDVVRVLSPGGGGWGTATRPTIGTLDT